MGIPQIHPPTQTTLEVPSLTHVDEAVAVVIDPPVTSVAVGGGSTDCGSDSYLAQIYQNESGCCPTKWQGQHVCPTTYSALYDPSDGWIGYGLCQSTPAIKMASTGADWQTNWETQNAWCTDYANSRYGSTALAWAHWQTFHNW